MPKPKSGQPMRGQDATESDLHQILVTWTTVRPLPSWHYIQVSHSSKKRESGSMEGATFSAKSIARLMVS